MSDISPVLPAGGDTAVLVVLWAGLGLVVGIWTAPIVALFRDYDDTAADVTEDETGQTRAVGLEPDPSTTRIPERAADRTDEGSPEAEQPDPPLPPPPECPHCFGAIPWPAWAPLPPRLLWTRACPHCAASLRGGVLVPVLTAVTFALLALGLSSGVERVAFSYLGAVGVLLAVVDARTRRLPNPLVLPTYPVALALLTVAALSPAHETAQLAHALIGALGVGGCFLILWLIHPAGMGWGDVKLSGVLGLYLGWLGLASTLLGTFSAFLGSTLVGLLLLLAGRAGRTTQIPLGPFLLTGLLIAVLAGPIPVLLPG
ncbi:A24 family peptidase [Lipingzhangella sp. LS1_29]|uniref:A24 family peptidase n=1 Tax=Lipingzhangella rawalii TaxID=2055835 RepID=A0ABU2H480_9ACTN|nr:A24 family peptidase [Lipingzhangella rawalii]